MRAHDRGRRTARARRLQGRVEELLASHVQLLQQLKHPEPRRGGCSPRHAAPEAPCCSCAGRGSPAHRGDQGAEYRRAVGQADVCSASAAAAPGEPAAGDRCATQLNGIADSGGGGAAAARLLAVRSPSPDRADGRPAAVPARGCFDACAACGVRRARCEACGAACGACNCCGGCQELTLEPQQEQQQGGPQLLCIYRRCPRLGRDDDLAEQQSATIRGLKRVSC